MLKNLCVFNYIFCVKAEDNASKGKLRVAVEEFKGALAVDPDHLAHNVHLHLGLCKVLIKLGRGKDALNSCSEALKINEELIEALVQVCYNFQHHFACFACQQIIFSFINVMSSDTGQIQYCNIISCRLHSVTYLVFYVALLQRGEAKLLTEDWEGAVEDLKSAAQKSPQVC